MNKSDLLGIRKEFKKDNSMFKIKEVYSVYLKKDNQAVIHSEFNFFESMESEKQELYIKNFKKILSGALDVKLFELDFDSIKEENAKDVLHEIVENQDNTTLVESCNEIITRISNNYKYDTDVVITFVKAKYFKSLKKENEEAEEAEEDNNMFALEFMMCSVNKIEQPKKSLQFDYTEKEFIAKSPLEFIVNLNSPLDGFMYPCFNNNSADINRLMYYSSKPQVINGDFVQNVLNCQFSKTAKEEKEEFNAILKTAIGDEITPKSMQDIYEKLVIDPLEDNEGEDETPIINMEDMKMVLEESGIEIKAAELEKNFEEIAGDSNYNFKAQNIVPNLNSKSIKIANENINIAINPEELKAIKQVRNSQGRKCLLIEFAEDIIIDGFNIKTEKM